MFVQVGSLAKTLWVFVVVDTIQWCIEDKDV